MKYLFVFLLVGLVSCGIDGTLKQPSCDETEGLQVADPSLIPDDYSGLVFTCREDMVWRQADFDNGEIDGLYLEWDRNGQLRKAENYKEGERVGLRREWYDNGQLKEEYNVDEGIFSKKCFDRKGKQIDCYPDIPKCFDKDGNQIKCD